LIDVDIRVDVGVEVGAVEVEVEVREDDHHFDGGAARARGEALKVVPTTQKRALNLSRAPVSSVLILNTQVMLTVPHDLFALGESLLDGHVVEGVVRPEVVHFFLDREHPLITLQGGEGFFDPTRLEGVHYAAVGVVDDFLPVDRELLAFGEVERGVNS
jgi:hypothetical protein